MGLIGQPSQRLQSETGSVCLRTRFIPVMINLVVVSLYRDYFVALLSGRGRDGDIYIH